jgi:hypothetical protein
LLKNISDWEYLRMDLLMMERRLEAMELRLKVNSCLEKERSRSSMSSFIMVS